MKGGSHIAAYKDYAAKHLPRVETLGGLWAPDFDPLAYPDNDLLAGVEQYLLELRPYTKVLSRAAELRQIHYDKFVTDEDAGHRAWRKGMNRVAADARAKLEYWTTQRDSLFDEAIEAFERRPLSDVREIVHVRRVEEVLPKVIFEPTPRPALSKRERNRRRRANQQRRAREDRRLLEQAIAEKESLKTELVAATKLTTIPKVRMSMVELFTRVKSANKKGDGLVRDLIFADIEITKSCTVETLAVGLELTNPLSACNNDRFRTRRLMCVYRFINVCRKCDRFGELFIGMIGVFRQTGRPTPANIIFGSVHPHELRKLWTQCPPEAYAVRSWAIARYKKHRHVYAIIALHYHTMQMRNIIDKKQAMILSRMNNLRRYMCGYAELGAPKKLFGVCIDPVVSDNVMEAYKDTREKMRKKIY